jgi:hypothetical protein
MKVWEIVKEEASAGATGAGSIAAVAMPLFTGKKGKAHHKAARKAVGLESKDATVHAPVYTQIIRRVP